jgi:hypothetical protein
MWNLFTDPFEAIRRQPMKRFGEEEGAKHQNESDVELFTENCKRKQ